MIQAEPHANTNPGELGMGFWIKMATFIRAR
jgi:hypothetical protein